jgi:hypothetical protein
MFGESIVACMFLIALWHAGQVVGYGQFLLITLPLFVRRKDLALGMILNNGNVKSKLFCVINALTPPWPASLAQDNSNKLRQKNRSLSVACRKMG